jgi:hypothetical protein
MSFDIDTDSSLWNMIGFKQLLGLSGDPMCILLLFTVGCCNITEGTGFIRAKRWSNDL